MQTNIIILRGKILDFIFLLSIISTAILSSASPVKSALIRNINTSDSTVKIISNNDPPKVGDILRGTGGFTVNLDITLQPRETTTIKLSDRGSITSPSGVSKELFVGDFEDLVVSNDSDQVQTLDTEIVFLGDVGENAEFTASEKGLWSYFYGVGLEFEEWDDNSNGREINPFSTALRGEIKVVPEPITILGSFIAILIGFMLKQKFLNLKI